MRSTYRNGSTLPPFASTSRAAVPAAGSAKKSVGIAATDGRSPTSPTKVRNSSQATAKLMTSSGSFSVGTDTPATANTGAVIQDSTASM